MNYIKMLNIIKQYTQIENNPNEVVGTQLNEIFYFVLKNSEGSDAINITTSAIQLAKVTPTSPVTKKKEGIFAIYLPGKYINYGGVELHDNSIGFIIKNKRNEYYIIQYKNPFTSSDGSFDDSTIVTELQANKDMINAIQEQLNDVDNTPFVRIDGMQESRPIKEIYTNAGKDNDVVCRLGPIWDGTEGTMLSVRQIGSPDNVSLADISLFPYGGIYFKSYTSATLHLGYCLRLDVDTTPYMVDDDLALTQVSFVKYLLKNKLGEILSESDPSNIEQIRRALGL